MKIYISIPITGHDLATQRAKAEQVAAQIRALGHEPVNPFDTPAAPASLSKREQYAYYMGEDIKRLIMCDAMLTCPGWDESRGCRVEFSVATNYHLHYYAHIGQIPTQ